MKNIKYVLLCLIMIMATTLRIDATENENKYILGGNLIDESIID